jgi:hypothetical protein
LPIEDCRLTIIRAGGFAIDNRKSAIRGETPVTMKSNHHSPRPWGEGGERSEPGEGPQTATLETEKG